MIREGGPHDDDVLPQLFDEREVANLLRVKQATVRGERIRGRLGYTRIGTRIFYTYQQIMRYLERQSVQACANNTTNAWDKSATTGSARSRGETARTRRGAGPGTTSERDRHAVSALAQQIFRRRASASRNGSSRTNEGTRPLLTKS
jgi:Helix-turn-helix domain